METVQPLLVARGRLFCLNKPKGVAEMSRTLNILVKTDAKIAILESQLQKLRAFRDLIEDCELFEVIKDVTAEPPKKITARLSAIGKPGSSSVNGRRPNQYYERIKLFFVERNNQPATLKEIRDAAGLDRGRVTNIVYVKRRNYFDRIEPDLGEKHPKFRLHPQYLV